MQITQLVGPVILAPLLTADRDREPCGDERCDEGGFYRILPSATQVCLYHGEELITARRASVRLG